MSYNIKNLAKMENHNFFIREDFFYKILRKILRLIINVDIFFCLLVVLYIWLVFQNYAVALYVGIIILLLYTFVVLFPLGQWLCVWLENRISPPLNLPSDIEGIFVLGSGFDQRISLARKTPSYNLHLGRLIDFVRLAKLHPKVKLAYSGGGRISAPEANEALLAKNLFKLCGLETSRVLFEKQSQDTNENIMNAFELLKPAQERPWVLVTSALHLPRAVCLCEKIGWKVIPYPVDFHTDGKPQYFNISPLLGFYFWYMSLHELIEMFLNYLFGYSDKLYP